jgi:hypothetical protein
VATQKPEEPWPNAFMWEDFSSTREGALPADWIGSQELVVGPVGRSKALFVSAGEDFTLGGSVVIPVRPRGNNDLSKFSVQVPVVMDKYCNSSRVELQVGAIDVSLVCGGACCSWVNFNDDRAEADTSKLGSGRVTSLELQRDGEVFKFLVNGRQIFLKRIPNYTMPSEVTLALGGHRGGPLVRGVFGLALGPSGGAPVGGAIVTEEPPR